jgi:hypothetical protein
MKLTPQEQMKFDKAMDKIIEQNKINPIKK